MALDILIVDDEADIRDLVEGILEDEGYQTESCANSTDAYKIIDDRKPSLVILDIWLQGSEDDGLAILANIQKNAPHIPVLMISGHGTIETAVSAIKEGAYDFIEKPFKSDRLLLMIKRALETAKLKRENEVLKKRSSQYVVTDIVGVSPAIEKLRQLIERVAPTNSRVLISGEQGSGKNVVARLLHVHSNRAEKPFIVVNCANLNSEHLEAELFGSNLVGQPHQGLLEQANGGTVLLDEISDMSLDIQSKIVRVLQEHRFQKSGSADYVDLDVRILASTNRDIEELVKQGAFREDLYYRLNVVPIHVPALRERAKDIEALIASFVVANKASAASAEAYFDEAALKKLKKYSWPGNVRQLQNVIEWVLIMHGFEPDNVWRLEHLPVEISGLNANSSSSVDSDENETSFEFIQDGYMELALREAREVFERSYLLAQIERFEGNISHTAQFIGMERSALHRKLKSLRVHEGNNSDIKSSETQLKRA